MKHMCGKLFLQIKFLEASSISTFLSRLNLSCWLVKAEEEKINEGIRIFRGQDLTSNCNLRQEATNNTYIYFTPCILRKKYFTSLWHSQSCKCFSYYYKCDILTRKSPIFPPKTGRRLSSVLLIPLNKGNGARPSDCLVDSPPSQATNIALA